MDSFKPHYTFILTDDNKHIKQIKFPTGKPVTEIGGKNLKEIELNDEGIATIKDYFQGEIEKKKQENANKIITK